MVLALSAFLSLASTVTLVRGTDGYWACEDTTLSRATPDNYAGGDSILEGGPGKTILIQYRDLERVIGPQMQVKSATLVLTLTGGTARLAACRTVAKPWTEGPFRALMGSERYAVPARWAATWNARRTGSERISWQLAGARGEDDGAAVGDAALTAQGSDQVQISGLGAALQRQSERWWECNGFALEFAEPVEFLSSNASEGRPKLILQMEPKEVPSGASDLSIISIGRTPEYERYKVRENVVDGVPAPEGVDNLDSRKWPSEAEMLTYTATIKNVGTAKSAGFDAQWLVREEGGKAETIAKELGPGEETTLSIQVPFRSVHGDHRRLPLLLRIWPKGEDASAQNNALQICQNGLNIGVVLTPEAADKLKSAINLKGSKSPEDWVQGQVDLWNEVWSRYSRYTFAPEGSLERVRVQWIKVGDPPADDLKTDGIIVVTPAMLEGELTKECAPMLRAIARACGLADLRGHGNFGGEAYGGLLGGDTRFDGGFPRMFWLPSEPWSVPLVDVAKAEANGFLSCVDVGALNAHLGKRRGYYGEYLYDIAQGVLINVCNRRGETLANADLKFTQPNGYSFIVNSGPKGAVALPNRPIGGVQPESTQTGHRLRPNPYGRLDPSGKNGVFLVETTVNGVRATTFLRAWDLVGAYYRGQTEASLVNLYFDVPGAPLAEQPLGKCTALAALTDGKLDEAVTLANEPIEIDLGGEFSVGQVRFTADAIWPGFEIWVRGNAEAPEKNRLFCKEGNGGWWLTNRAENGTLSYRGLAKKVRFVTIKPTGGAAILKEIEVTPARG